MINSYVCIDLETTGLNPKTDKIIEIGAVKVEDGRETDRFMCFVNPGRALTERIVELTGIKETDLNDAPEIQDVIGEVVNFTEGYVLLGHSIMFDYSFLKKAAVNQRLEFERSGIDTLKIARKHLSDLQSRSLDFLCGYYGIEHKAHRAMEDAQATSLLYHKLAADFDMEDNERDFLPTQLHYHPKREIPATKHQKERLLELINRHSLSVEYEIESLTRNEASRFTDQILAKYGR